MERTGVNIVKVIVDVPAMVAWLRAEGLANMSINRIKYFQVAASRTMPIFLS